MTFDEAWLQFVDGADSTDGAMAFKSECQKIWDAGVKHGEDTMRELCNKPFSAFAHSGGADHD